MLTAEKNRRANSPKVIHKGIDEHIRWLEKRLSGLDHELAGLVRETPIWREHLRSLPPLPPFLSYSARFPNTVLLGSIRSAILCPAVVWER
jgi:hypothetical protein